MYQYRKINECEQTIIGNTTDQSVKVLIEGRVQGVWFRGWAQKTARSLELNGWVQNRRDGSVHAVFSGSEIAVEEMLRLCRDGPRAAGVSSVKSIPHTFPVPAGFHIRKSR